MCAARDDKGCQFSSTDSRRLQMRIIFRPWDKQVAIKAVKGCIPFRPRLLFMLASRSIKNSNNEVSRYAAVKSYLATLNDVTSFSPLSTNKLLPCLFLILLLPYPLTVSSCHSPYSVSDMQIRKRISRPFTCSCTVSSLNTWMHFPHSWLIWAKLRYTTHPCNLKWELWFSWNSMQWKLHFTLERILHSTCNFETPFFDLSAIICYKNIHYEVE
jgi:hypothetical protein